MARHHPDARWIPALAALVLVGFDAGAASGQKTVIEFEKAPARVVRPKALGTGRYRPRKAEKPFLDRLEPKERTTGTFFQAYDPKGRKGKFVSWFGIVRKIESTKNGTQLLLEHQYFDGMTDSHLQVVSLYGCGDFTARLKPEKAADSERIRHLELVRLYGKVTDEKDGVPVLAVEYARVFPWKTFTFMDYGKDQRRDVWKKLTRVTDRHQIYSATPADEYYVERLGPREEKPKKKP
jgi:hypothetical protein